ncbi:hypothetical protein BC939DRAFT_454229 [Gamsiella multidivaricata]|uniref:uncharacterized protein n=1 Tax=Gamsiella multidivaricata TaxID=101098 RepID=UPI002220B29A|nr:uncharacterized protein BC939DRAFT_454229 [Gamsiella multidivaricata]KAG0371118.1 hypothetical protein BGZ54_000062 [Gamsiella multidivaricata]KAI7822187.1 hypothetical protein BC939DRAFT_454229 [Gamsiella multidivaricata]
MSRSDIVEHNQVRYRIRVSAGPDLQTLRPLNVNDDANPMTIDTDEFVGHVVFRIKGLDQIHGYKEGQQQDGLEVMKDSPWFDKAAEAGRGGNLLSSMTIVGRFKREWPGEQVVFACVFDRPLNLPPLTSLAVKFFKAMDPGLRIDVQAPKPYYISPLLAAMNTVNVSKVCAADITTSTTATSLTTGSTSPAWLLFNGENLVEDTSMIVAVEEDVRKRTKIAKNAGARQSYFAKAKHLSKHRFEKDHVYGLELFDAYMDCSRFTLKLPGLSLDLYKYLNGQPITYVLRTQDGSTSFVALSIELVPVNDLSTL